MDIVHVCFSIRAMESGKWKSSKNVLNVSVGYIQMSEFSVKSK